MRMTPGGRRAMTGPLLTVVGGGLLAVGALLPWIEISYVLPGRRGHMVARTYAQSGWAHPEGQIVFSAGLVIAVAGIYMVGAIAGRGLGAFPAAVATVVATAVLAAWWERLSSSGPGVLVGAAGALIALAGILGSFPGSRTSRAVLFAGICGTSLCGFALALLVVKAPLIPAF